MNDEHDMHAGEADGDADHESADRIHDTDDRAAPNLVGRVYDDLHRIAANYLRGERPDHTLQPTALVHEAYLKVADRDAWKSATHFRAVASSAMRQILVDHARSRNRLRRGGDRQRVMLTANIGLQFAADIDVLALDEALDALAEFDERKARVVEMRFFGGLTAAESAAELGISRKTAEADWYFARAWLHERLATD